MVAIAGGTDAGIIPSVVTGLGFAGLLSTNNENPSKASRPFDILRTGGYLGEGAGIVVLESLEHALSRNATPYAEVLGFNTTCDYAQMECFGYELSMQKAIMNSGCYPQDISFISAHGSSSVELDEIETIAIKRLFKDYAYEIPVTSIKGATGNPLAGGAVMQAAAAMLTFKHGIIPPTTNYESPDPMCDLDYVGKHSRKQHLELALINSRGIGGVNSSLVLRNMD
jgi:3-oxoacyl-(acyl-carrier-protein) synthase